MNNTDVIIIGSGLIGSMTAKYFNKKGLGTTIIDEKNPLAASKCSFGVWKEGWISDKIKQHVLDGRDFLEEVCDGISTIEFFDLGKETIIEMSKVDCSLIIQEPDINAEVVAVKNKIVELVLDGEIYTLTANKAVIIAAGAFTDKLLKVSGYNKTLRNVDRYWGAVLDVNVEIDKSRIYTWAPYKQSVMLKNENGFSFGDGASVKNPVIDDKRVKLVSERLIQHMDDLAGANIDEMQIQVVKQGWRPYLPKGENSYIKQHDQNLFSATGGAKNTTILCSYIAKELYKNLVNAKITN